MSNWVPPHIPIRDHPGPPRCWMCNRRLRWWQMTTCRTCSPHFHDFMWLHNHMGRNTFAPPDRWRNR